MAEKSSSKAFIGLVHFDLPLVFRCAVELAEAAAALNPSDWADVPVDISGPDSPYFDRWDERHRRLHRIEEESVRVKRSLGAIGPLRFRDVQSDDGPKWESYDQNFNDTAHDRIVRLALNKIATAAVDLSGFATWREWQWNMRDTGLRLLTWGLAQLWEGMSTTERPAERDQLSRTRIATGWPSDATKAPPTYDGPDEIPLPDQYRIVSNYVSCCRTCLDDVQKANGLGIQIGQERFLRRATIEQYAEMAACAGKALSGIFKRDFDTPNEYGDVYSDAFWALACLRRSTEVPPFNAWPDSAKQGRARIAQSAELLRMSLGGTPGAQAKLKPAEIDKALEKFDTAVGNLRDCVTLEGSVEMQDKLAGKTKDRPTPTAIEPVPPTRRQADDDLTAVRELNSTALGFLGGEALAEALGIHPSRRPAFFKQLERERVSLGDENWQEASNRRANTPRFQYRVDSPRLREMAKAYKTPKLN
jgi:hypothetical protein